MREGSSFHQTLPAGSDIHTQVENRTDLLLVSHPTQKFTQTRDLNIVAETINQNLDDLELLRILSEGIKSLITHHQPDFINT